MSFSINDFPKAAQFEYLKLVFKLDNAVYGSNPSEIEEIIEEIQQFASENIEDEELVENKVQAMKVKYLGF